MKRGKQGTALPVLGNRKGLLFRTNPEMANSNKSMCLVFDEQGMYFCLVHHSCQQALKKQPILFPVSLWLRQG